MRMKTENPEIVKKAWRSKIKIGKKSKYSKGHKNHKFPKIFHKMREKQSILDENQKGKKPKYASKGPKTKT